MSISFSHSLVYNHASAGNSDYLYGMKISRMSLERKNHEDKLYDSCDHFLLWRGVITIEKNYNRGYFNFN